MLGLLYSSQVYRAVGGLQFIWDDQLVYESWGAISMQQLCSAGGVQQLRTVC
jgi:hypothetical protein